MSYQLDVSIPGLPPINSATAMHWRKRAKLRSHWKREVWYAVTGKKPPTPLQRSRVVITRNSAARPDPDNLTDTSKFLLDALVELGIIEDDSNEHIELEVLWEFAQQGKGFVRIQVDEVEGGSCGRD